MSVLGAHTEIARTEPDLVDAARAGDEQAFAELYQRYGGRIYSYVLGMVRDPNRAEDIAQDVFLSALRRMRDTDRGIAFKPWIYEIAKNACIDEYRRDQRVREVSLEQHDVDERLISPSPSPDACLAQRQQLADLHGAFRGLSKRQHKVIVLRELEGLSYTEIAARTGMTMAMVESTLLRARRRLGQEYADIASGRRCEQVHKLIDAGGQAAVAALGLRDRRRFAHHISHCQPCARQAWLAGISVSEKRTLAKRIAALLPAPLARFAFSRSRGHAGSKPRLRHAIGSSARRAAHLVPSGAPAGVGPAAAATMAAIAIAGSGVAVELLSHSRAREPAAVAGAVTARAAAMWTRPAHARGLNSRLERSLPATPGSSSGSRSTGASAARSAHAVARGRSHPGASASAPGSTAGGSGSSSAHRPSSSLPSTPSVPSIPRVPVDPHTPSFLRHPSLPHLPSLSRHPSVPHLPSLPQRPSLPHLPSLPRLPSLPKLPAVSQALGGHSLPPLPSLPRLPSLPKLPAVSQALGGHSLPPLPSLPQRPSLPHLPSLPQRQSLPKLPAVPQAPAAHSLTPLPSLPQRQSVPHLPSLPQRPSVPKLPAVPQAPGGHSLLPLPPVHHLARVPAEHLL